MYTLNYVKVWHVRFYLFGDGDGWWGNNINPLFLYLNNVYRVIDTNKSEIYFFLFFFLTYWLFKVYCFIDGYRFVPLLKSYKLHFKFQLLINWNLCGIIYYWVSTLYRTSRIRLILWSNLFCVPTRRRIVSQFQCLSPVACKCRLEF